MGMTQTTSRLTSGQSRMFRIRDTSVHISVALFANGLYTVRAASRNNLGGLTEIQHYYSVFTPENSPAGDARGAAWTYVQCIARDYRPGLTDANARNMLEVVQ